MALNIIKEILLMFWTAITTLVPAEIKMFFDIKSAVDSTAHYFDAYHIVLYVLTGVSSILCFIRLKLTKHNA